MQRSFSDHIGDAGDLARRTNLQILALLASLALAWLSGMEPHYSTVPSSVTSLARLEIARVNTNRVIGEIRGRLIGTTDDLLQARSSRITSCGDGRDAKACAEARNSITSLTAKFERQRNLLQSRRSIGASQIEQLRRLREAIAKQVSFDLGLGVKLPFSFAYAALVWLLVLAFVLYRMFVQRAKFWRLVAAGVHSLTLAQRVGLEQHLIDMPFWLNPPPRRAKERVRSEAMRSVVGWNGGVRQWLWCLSMLVIAAIAARVAWIGLTVSGLAAKHGIQAGFVQVAIAGAATLVIALGIALALPWWTSSRRDAPLYRRRQRRIVLGGGAVLLGLFAVQASTSAAFALRWKGARDGARRGARRFKKRRSPTSALSGEALRPGWYRNQNSGAVHYLRSGNKVRGARGLAAGNLVWFSPDLGELSTLNRGVPDWTASKDLPEFLLDLASEYRGRGRSGDAVDILVRGADYCVLTDRVGAGVRLLDRAVQIAMRENLAAGLEAAMRVARRIPVSGMSENLRTRLESKVAKWSSIVIRSPA